MTQPSTTPLQTAPPTASAPAAQPQRQPETKLPDAPPVQSDATSLTERQPLSPQDAEYRRVVTQIEAGQYEAALRASQGKQATDVRLRNAAGVCLLRLGRHAAAVQLYRPLVFAPDGLTMRRDVPDVVRLNFATALLLDGRSAGCADILRHVDRGLPGVQQLRRSLRAWQQTLGFGQRLCWKLGIGRPQTVTLDYPPGELL